MTAQSSSPLMTASSSAASSFSMRSTVTLGYVARNATRMGVSIRAKTLPTAPNRTVLAPAPACSCMRLMASSVRATMAWASGSRSCPLNVQLHVAPVPLEQPRAELGLEPGDLPAEGGLRGVDRRARPG